MIPEVPNYLLVTFIITTVATAFMLVAAITNSSSEVVRKRTHLAALLILFWLIFQSTLSLNMWYQDTAAIPPHLMFPVVVTLVLITAMFLIQRGKRFMDALNIEWLTWIHIVRIPVELCLWWLAQERLVPWDMTFEGRNFDIVTGITAPFIAYFGIRKNKLPAWVIVSWNIVAMGLLFNVVITAALSLQSPMQFLNFDQPNRAVVLFPFIWLPAFIVPVVLFSHLVVLRRFFFATRAS
ncbi:MAG: hypothetical protein SH856_00825 [Flavobacteriales bacterium]|nr:hypothetical protein [Flavobacteriales bacterium]